jgi:hypothetical protein
VADREVAVFGRYEILDGSRKQTQNLSFYRQIGLPECPDAQYELSRKYPYYPFLMLFNTMPGHR